MLIRNLNTSKSPKIVGMMRYNPTSQRWEGNESALKDFDSCMPVRPALIANMSSSKSVQVVGGMVFDPERMCWQSATEESEDDVFANIESSTDEEEDDMDCNKQFKVSDEFEITPGLLSEFMQAERQHKRDMGKWYPSSSGAVRNEDRFGLGDGCAFLYEIRSIANHRRRRFTTSGP